MGAAILFSLQFLSSWSPSSPSRALPAPARRPLRDQDQCRYVCPDCSGSSNRGASFEANLLRLRDSLHDMVPANTSFLNVTFAGGDAEDTVYVLAMCLTDMVLWYPHCLVRYGNTSFFSAADTSPARRFDVPNPNNYSDPARPDACLTRLASRMVAAAAASLARFAFRDEVTANMTLHGRAQCTQDLPVEECNLCPASHMA